LISLFLLPARHSALLSKDTQRVTVVERNRSSSIATANGNKLYGE
jgi:hypothetical protein